MKQPKKSQERTTYVISSKESRKNGKLGGKKKGKKSNKKAKGK